MYVGFGLKMYRGEMPEAKVLTRALDCTNANILSPRGRKQQTIFIMKVMLYEFQQIA